MVDFQRIRENGYLILLVIFALISILSLSIAAHEIYHSIYYIPVNYTNSEICIVKIYPITADEAGHFKYWYNASNYQISDIQKDISVNSENWAYVISTLVLMIGVWTILSYIFEAKFNPFRRGFNRNI